LSLPCQPVEKFGTQSEKGRVILAFRNGDKHHTGLKVTVHSTKFKTFDQLKEFLSKEVKLPTGAVRQIFTHDGKLVKKLEDLEDGGKYVCAGAEAFNKDASRLSLKNYSFAIEIILEIHVNIIVADDMNILLQLLISLVPTALTAAPEPVAVVEPPKETPPPAQVEEKKAPAPRAPPTKFGTQTAKGKVIMAFRNGDKHHAGVKVTIHATKFKSYDQLKDFLTKEVKLPTGAVLKVYTPDGKALKGLDDFEDGGKYVCAGAEKFNKVQVILSIFTF
jgi:hypothetical protein